MMLCIIVIMLQVFVGVCGDLVVVIDVLCWFECCCGMVVIISDFLGLINWMCLLWVIVVCYEVLVIEVFDLCDVELLDVGDVVLQDVEFGVVCEFSIDFVLCDDFVRVVVVYWVDVVCIICGCGVFLLLFCIDCDWFVDIV